MNAQIIKTPRSVDRNYTIRRFQKWLNTAIESWESQVRVHDIGWRRRPKQRSRLIDAGLYKKYAKLVNHWLTFAERVHDEIGSIRKSEGCPPWENKFPMGGILCCSPFVWFLCILGGTFQNVFGNCCALAILRATLPYFLLDCERLSVPCH